MADERRRIIRKMQDSDAEGQVLRQIRDILRERLPRLTQKKPWWRSGKLLLTAVLFGCLWIIDFPSESRSKADLVVYNGTEISLVKLTEPDWGTMDVKPSPNFWRIPDLPPDVGVTSVWQFSLYRQGRRYKHAAIRVVETDGEPLVDLSPKSVKIDRPTWILIAPIGEIKGDEKLRANAIVRTHGLRVGDQIVQLIQVIELTNWKNPCRNQA